MILIRRGKLVAYAALVVVAVVGLGAVGYATVRWGELGVKAAGERLLYLGIVASVIVVAATAWLLADHISFNRQLDRAAGMVRREGRLPDQKIRRLGVVGDRIAVLFDQLGAKNEALRNRIDAQRQVIEFETKNITQPMCITDVRGTVLYVTTAMLNRFDRPIGEVAGRRLQALVSDLDIDYVVRILDRTGEVHTGQDGRKFYPITDNRGVVNYVVYLHPAGRLEPHVAARQMTKPRGRIIDRARRFFGRSAG